MPKNLQKITLACLVSMAVLTWLQAQAIAGQPLPAGTWNPPLEAPIRLINQYRQPNSDYSAGHRGVDYLVKTGQPVLAPADGIVWFSGRVAQRPLISLRHNNGYLSEFEPVCSDLAKGEPVFAGQQIGYICQADNNYLPHCANSDCLHFSLRIEGAYLSPLVFIGGINPSRLLATPSGVRSDSRHAIAQ
jgi:murein DD-endopeptidase MepM/ murein hydrolase activator NlpD